jgi:hypothetical protein
MQYIKFNDGTTLFPVSQIRTEIRTPYELN